MTDLVSYDDKGLPVPQKVRGCGRRNRVGDLCKGTALRFLIEATCHVHATGDERAANDKAKEIWAAAVDEADALGLGFTQPNYEGATVMVVGNHLEVSFAYNTAVVDALRSIPGRRYNHQTKITRFPMAVRDKVIERLEKFGPVYEEDYSEDRGPLEEQVLRLENWIKKLQICYVCMALVREQDMGLHLDTHTED